MGKCSSQKLGKAIGAYAADEAFNGRRRCFADLVGGEVLEQVGQCSMPPCNAGGRLGSPLRLGAAEVASSRRSAPVSPLLREAVVTERQP
jgi:hypothetical protein